MAAHNSGRWEGLFKAFKHERAALASALVVAVVLLGFLQAPTVPVLIGCGVAFGFFLVGAFRRLLSS